MSTKQIAINQLLPGDVIKEIRRPDGEGWMTVNWPVAELVTPADWAGQRNMRDRVGVVTTYEVTTRKGETKAHTAQPIDFDPDDTVRIDAEQAAILRPKAS